MHGSSFNLIMKENPDHIRIVKEKYITIKFKTIEHKKGKIK